MAVPVEPEGRGHRRIVRGRHASVALTRCARASGPCSPSCSSRGAPRAVLSTWTRLPRRRATRLSTSIATRAFSRGDTKIADLSQGGYTWFHIRSGSYVLTQKWGALSLMKDLSLNVRWQAGSTYYYRFEVDGDFYVVAHRITWRLAEVSAAEAMPKLHERSLQPAYDLDKIWGNWPWLKPPEEDKH